MTQQRAPGSVFPSKQRAPEQVTTTTDDSSQWQRNCALFPQDVPFATVGY